MSCGAHGSPTATRAVASSVPYGLFDQNEMSTKQIDVSCPCCNTRLTIDVLTKAILRHAPPEQLDETGKAILDEGRWDEATGRVSDRKSASLDKFENALGKERSREKDLEDLFDKARRKAQSGDEADEQ